MCSESTLESCFRWCSELSRSVSHESFSKRGRGYRKSTISDAVTLFRPQMRQSDPQMRQSDFQRRRDDHESLRMCRFADRGRFGNIAEHEILVEIRFLFVFPSLESSQKEISRLFEEVRSFLGNQWDGWGYQGERLDDSDETITEVVVAEVEGMQTYGPRRHPELGCAILIFWTNTWKERRARRSYAQASLSSHFQNWTSTMDFFRSARQRRARPLFPRGTSQKRRTRRESLAMIDVESVSIFSNVNGINRNFRNRTPDQQRRSRKRHWEILSESARSWCPDWCSRRGSVECWARTTSIRKSKYL